MNKIIKYQLILLIFWKSEIFKNVLCETNITSRIEIDLSKDIEWNGNWAFRCNFPNTKHLTSETSQDTECGEICNRFPLCTHFVWENRICWLKQGSVSRRDAFKVNNAFTCGFSYFGLKAKLCGKESNGVVEKESF